MSIIYSYFLLVSGVIIINTSKNEPVTYINYEDICFSSGIERPCQFYFIHVAPW